MNFIYLFCNQDEEEKVPHQTNDRDCRQGEAGDDVVQLLHVFPNNVSRLT